MHGNASCRIGVLSNLSMLLVNGISVFAFDSSGSGLSDGEYVSLGYHEKDDLYCVVNYIRQSVRSSTIALWGRSMGSVTALLYGDSDPTIAGLVLDSPFKSLHSLCLEMVDRLQSSSGWKVPVILAKTALHIIRGSIQRKANFDIYKVSPIDYIHKSKTVLYIILISFIFNNINNI